MVSFLRSLQSVLEALQTCLNGKLAFSSALSLSAAIEDGESRLDEASVPEWTCPSRLDASKDSSSSFHPFVEVLEPGLFQKLSSGMPTLFDAKAPKDVPCGLLPTSPGCGLFHASVGCTDAAHSEGASQPTKEAAHNEGAGRPWAPVSCSQ
jgi:hypothetical protein